MDGFQRKGRRTESGAAGLLRCGEVSSAFEHAVRSLPDLRGGPIHVSFQCNLRVARGKLVHSGGAEVHAATFLRERRMILDNALRNKPRELRRILVHELFHFVWRRLGNASRHEWHELIEAEFRQHARGELGWSSEWRKMELHPSAVSSRTRKWREYLCESFCDSAASLFVRSHGEISLAPRFRVRRERWLVRLMNRGPLPV